MSQTPEDIRQDGYIECTECGHTLDHDHGPEGCTSPGCMCRLPWTPEEVRDLRASYGLTN